MKQLIFFLVASSSLLLTSCGSEPAAEETLSQDKLAEVIRALDGTLQQQMNQVILDTATARTLADRAQEYAQRFLHDTLAPKFLFRAANVSRGIGDFERAVELWDELAVNYEDFKRAPDALFLQALTLDENLKDTDRAREKYRVFLKEHPQHPLAKDARLLLEAIQSGKTADELVKGFREQERKQEE